MSSRPVAPMAILAASIALTACATRGSAGEETAYGDLRGVLAADGPVLFVPVGSDDRGCTQYTKKPLREGLMVDTGIWYRTADGHFDMDADRCKPHQRPVPRED